MMMVMMEKDLSVVGALNQLLYLPELDQNLRPNYRGYMLVLASLAIHVNHCHNDIKLL